jgi:hypothetical protein
MHVNQTTILRFWPTYCQSMSYERGSLAVIRNTYVANTSHRRQLSVTNCVLYLELLISVPCPSSITRIKNNTLSGN